VGILSRSSTILRFVAMPPTRIDREALARAITCRAFRALDPDGGDTRQSCGWFAIHDPLVSELNPADVFFQQYLIVGFRLDRRAVPAKLLYLERRRAEEAMRLTLDRARLGRTVRQQIKADVEARLMLRALPVPRLFDVAWNLESGRVYLTGKMRLAREAFIDLFRETFGVAPVPLIPYLAAEHVGLGARVLEAVRGVEPAGLVGEPVPEEHEVPRLPLQQVEA
jgi:hypothetical protein